MPDLDIIAAGISPVWGRPYRLLAGAGNPTDVARAIMQSLAGSIRRYGGFPEISAMGSIIDKVASGQLEPAAAFAPVRAMVMKAGGILHAEMVARAADRLIAEQAQGLPSHISNSYAVTAYACEALVANRLFDRARIRLIGSRFASPQKAAAFEEATKVEVLPQIARFAANLVRNQSGVGIHAPRWQAPARRTTADQLHEPIITLQVEVR